MEWIQFDREDVLPDYPSSGKPGSVIMLEPDDNSKIILIRVEEPISWNTLRILGACISNYSFCLTDYILVDLSNVDPELLSRHGDVIADSSNRMRTEDLELVLILGESHKRVLSGTNLAQCFTGFFKSPEEALEALRDNASSKDKNKLSTGKPQTGFWRFFCRFRRQ